MIAEYTFPFGTKDIKIQFTEELPEKYLEGLLILIENFERELNKNIPNSSAYKFNQAQVGIPTFVKEEFLQFIEENTKYLGLDNEFKPFNTTDDKVLVKLDDYLIIDHESLSIIKKQEIELNYNILNKYFIIDKINQFLIENQKLGYLLVSDNILSSFGKLKWKANFLSDQEIIHFKLLNQNAILEPVNLDNSQRKPVKFANPEKEIRASKVILVGENKACYLKILSLLVKNLYFKSDFVEFAQNYKVEIILLDNDGKVIPV